MTMKSRRSASTRPGGALTKAEPPSAPEVLGPVELVPDPKPEKRAPVITRPIPEPDRLEVLRDYVDHEGLLPVVVVVSHDAVFMGQHLRIPVTDRAAGLIEVGFLEVEPPEPGTRR